MTVAVDGETRFVWPVSTGKLGYDTPNGTFKVNRMDADHLSQEWDNAPMPHTMFFDMRGHAIHGFFDVKHLGSWLRAAGAGQCGDTVRAGAGSRHEPDHGSRFPARRRRAAAKRWRGGACQLGRSQRSQRKPRRPVMIISRRRRLLAISRRRDPITIRSGAILGNAALRVAARAQTQGRGRVRRPR